ncbi:MAG TPA: hypothetical protein VFZ65_21955 [Planctomycetota bacterium]|nr:hypothetical protein [Planctomycetota bacterium]
MKALSSLLAIALATALGAQSPLTTLQATYPANSLFLWTGYPPGTNMFFNLAANTTVTIQGLDVQLDVWASPPGVVGNVEMWVTNAGITTYAGNEANMAQWTLAGTGSCTSAGNAPSPVGFPNGIVLQPGTKGIALRFLDLKPLFLLGNSTAVPGGAGAGTNQYYQNAELTLLAGTTQAVGFTGGALASYVWLGSIYYSVGNNPHALARNKKFGKGCYTTIGSFYQRFTTPAAAAAALNGRAISLVFTGNGYALVPASGVTFIPPSASAMALPANDNAETPVSLTSPFVYPGGVTTQLFVQTNGYVSVATNNVQVPNNAIPNVIGLLDSPVTAWWSWHNYNTTEAGSGLIKFEEVGSLAIITWDNVESYPALNGTTPVVNPSTWQFQFDTATGQVNYVWQTITNNGLSNVNDEHLVGFSPGGPSPDPGPTNLTTLVAVPLTVPEVYSLTLDATPAPLPGNTVSITTSNETGMNLGVNFICLGAVQPGFPLGILGMPGCEANVDINTGVGNLIGNLPGFSMTLMLPIPASLGSLLGQQLHSQSIWLDGTANAFGAIVSNGLTMQIGNF